MWSIPEKGRTVCGRELRMERNHMNRAEFMRQLESLLQNISPAEREEALQYYNDYFNDAGPDSEQAVIEALGNPAKVAENIKRDLYGSGYGDGAASRAQASGREVVEYGKTYGNAQAQPDKKMSTGMIVLIVILCVLASPIAIGLLGGVIGVAGGLLAGWVSILFGLGLAAIILLSLMLIIGVIGVFSLFYSPMVGLGLLGAGLVCGGIGILFLMLTVAMAGIATPAIFKGIVSLCRSIFGKKKDAA